MPEESDDDTTPPEPAVRRLDDETGDGSDSDADDAPQTGNTPDSDDTTAGATDSDEPLDPEDDPDTPTADPVETPADDDGDAGDDPNTSPTTMADDPFDGYEVDTTPAVERDSLERDADDDEDGPDETDDIGDRGDASFDDGSPGVSGSVGDSAEVAQPGPVSEPEEFEGAPDDQEMPLADHIEEMVKRLGVVIVVMAAVSGVVFPFATYLINFLWFNYLPGTEEICRQVAQVGATNVDPQTACARVYHPLAVVLARLKVATLAGFVVALPLFVYETYLFMRPGLYPRERRYYLASVPTSLVLAAAGMLFAHHLVIPILFDYFVGYSEGATTLAFGLTETFDLIVLMLGAFAIVFQIPLFIMLALMMGLVTRTWLQSRRLIFWGLFAALAFLFTGDPTGLGPIFVAVTMIVLFEGTLLLAQWTGHE
ncbi:MFS transporter [Halosegnis rubeus]|jgi:sec-independent protein translocase protein TatC|uniref:Sec-independent protein translocase protein TatC n=1 Tax=Halosegnis rubeus TaxID=2212850 RepID=A0A5N5UBX5_9EURY|nr:twin-arginine translocase subunit TatC [Halosegnis rubeus]KAB7515142.1 MFS transporter [Halosegnis rubeus]KAB7516196.1 MFS transporter [Halosegnis rubeus]KAB7517502.1 MFS transporter [Halosegnis rubeus]